MTRNCLSLLFLVACGGDPPDCPEGYIATGAGLCLAESSDPDPVDPPPATVADLIAQLPPCSTTAPAEPKLDLIRSCYAGVCAGEAYGAFLAEWGDPTACEVMNFTWDGQDFEQSYCTWDPGIELSVPSTDGVIAPSTTVWGIDIDLPNADLSAGGSGIGTEWRCLVDELGMPRSISFNLSGPIAAPTFMTFGSVAARDYVDNALGLNAPDGLIDSLTLYGF